MKKIILGIIFTLNAFFLHAQLPEAENDYKF
jgi:hypothetical protein